MTCDLRPTFTEIEGWVDEYRRQGHVDHVTVRVLRQDDPEHEESGMVAVHLIHGPASISLNVDCDRRWTAALSERSGEFPLTGTHLVALGEELTTTGKLCEYLQSRTG